MRSLKNILIVFLGVIAAAVAGALVVRKSVPAFGDEASDEFSIVAAMSGRTFESRAGSLHDGRVFAVFGGVELDLVRATIGAGATIVLKAVFGGIDVIVPANWRVEVISNEVLGGIGNLTDPDAHDDAPLLLIDATAIFGGIEIHAQEAA
jgi:hypothetical protein